MHKLQQSKLSFKPFLINNDCNNKTSNGLRDSSNQLGSSFPQESSSFQELSSSQDSSSSQESSSSHELITLRESAINNLKIVSPTKSDFSKCCSIQTDPAIGKFFK